MGANTNTEQIQFLIQNCICSLPILEQIQSKYKQIPVLLQYLTLYFLQIPQQILQILQQILQILQQILQQITNTRFQWICISISISKEQIQKQIRPPVITHHFNRGRAPFEKKTRLPISQPLNGVKTLKHSPIKHAPLNSKDG